MNRAGPGITARTADREREDRPEHDDDGGGAFGSGGPGGWGNIRSALMATRPSRTTSSVPRPPDTVLLLGGLLGFITTDHDTAEFDLHNSAAKLLGPLSDIEP